MNSVHFIFRNIVVCLLSNSTCSLFILGSWVELCLESSWVQCINTPVQYKLTFSFLSEGIRTSCYQIKKFSNSDYIASVLSARGNQGFNQKPKVGGEHIFGNQGEIKREEASRYSLLNRRNWLFSNSDTDTYYLGIVYGHSFNSIHMFICGLALCSVALARTVVPWVLVSKHML